MAFSVAAKRIGAVAYAFNGALIPGRAKLELGVILPIIQLFSLRRCGASVLTARQSQVTIGGFKSQENSYQQFMPACVFLVALRGIAPPGVGPKPSTSRARH